MNECPPFYNMRARRERFVAGSSLVAAGGSDSL
ncbi:hypothetical protein I656_00262 [Geobacillus sp. WSUCF1]|nr:hypothetical protein I656_00262 [Geobacillus sp. WSUCF1]